VLGQKTKLSKKVFKDISLTAKPGVYSHQITKNTHNLFNSIKIYQIVTDLWLNKKNNSDGKQKEENY
jgi:hypothetical protein